MNSRDVRALIRVELSEFFSEKLGFLERGISLLERVDAVESLVRTLSSKIETAIMGLSKVEAGLSSVSEAAKVESRCSALFRRFESTEAELRKVAAKMAVAPPPPPPPVLIPKLPPQTEPLATKAELFSLRNSLEKRLAKAELELKNPPGQKILEQKIEQIAELLDKFLSAPEEPSFERTAPVRSASRSVKTYKKVK